MQFSELLDSMQERGGAWTASVGDDWLQGRSVFGGLQAAIALKAMRSLVPGGIPLRTLQVTFVAPVPAGTVTAQARVLRTGKSAIQVEALIVEGDAVLCVVLGVFGASFGLLFAAMRQWFPGTTLAKGIGYGAVLLVVFWYSFFETARGDLKDVLHPVVIGVATSIVSMLWIGYAFVMVILLGRFERPWPTPLEATIECS